MKSEFFTIAIATKILDIETKEIKKIMKLLPIKISPDRKFLNRKAMQIIQTVHYLSQDKKYSYEDAIEEIFKPNNKAITNNLNSSELSLFHNEELSEFSNIDNIKNSINEIINFLQND